MMISMFSLRLLAAIVAAALIAACSSGSRPASALPAAGAAFHAAAPGQVRGGRSYSVAATSNAHGTIEHFKQWMEPGAVKNRLLYVSDFSANIVQVYNYPSQGTQNPPAGTLTGFTNPQGLCVDNRNNVYVDNTGGENVLEYAYGATSPSASWNDSGEYPVGCSIDPTDGTTLAISDIFSPTTGQGAATICSSPSSCTTYVEPGGLLECYFIAYVPNGDLYVVGFDSSGVGMAYLPHGSTTWQPATIEGSSIVFPGQLQYAGGYLVVGDQSGSSGTTLYRCTPSGSVVDCNGGSTVLSGTTDVVQWFIKRGVAGVTGADNSSKTESTWAYPAGGSMRPNKTFTIDDGTYSTLIGNAVLLPAR